MFPKVNRKDKIFISVLVIIILALLGSAYMKYRPSSNVNYDMKLAENSAIESHVLIAGDIYWGRRMNDWSQQSPLKEKYPFHKLDSLERDKYDAWIANLECPAVPGIKQKIGFVPQLWEFNCDTDYLKEASEWLDIVSLANNHTANQNHDAGLLSTRKALEDNNIQYFGNYTPHKTGDICEVVSLPSRALIENKEQRIMLPVAMCGYAGVYFTITDNAIKQIDKYSKVMPVIVMPHMGLEYSSTVDEKRQKLYRSMIDHGADVVIGNHPHWVQQTEAYKGKLIAYSMGNFIFDQDFSEEVMRSAAFDTILSVDKTSVSPEQIKAWSDLGKNCANYKDTCLAQAQDLKLKKLPVKFTFNVVGVDTSNKVTHRANQKLKNEILERLDWSSTSNNLEKNYIATSEIKTNNINNLQNSVNWEQLKQNIKN